MRILRLILLMFGQGVGAWAATNAIDTAAFGYNQKTTVQAYDSVGHKDSRWNSDVRECLRLYARYISFTNVNDVARAMTELKDALPKVVVTGCDDPLIQFLSLQSLSQEGLAPPVLGSKAAECANALEKSGYPDIRKFYAALYARDCVRYSGDPQNQSSNWCAVATQNLAKALEDRTVPQWLADRWVDALLNGYGPMDANVWGIYRKLQPVLDRSWTNASFALVAKGRGYLSQAWAVRGQGETGAVLPENWRAMLVYAGLAEQGFEAAWKSNPRDVRICGGMMHVELLLGRRLEDMDVWFERGMKLDPSNFDLCSIRLEYLKPRWHGSPKEMVDFGRFCTGNTNWSGPVRLMVAYAHDAIASSLPDEQRQQDYWSKPEVWEDIRSAFEQFLKLYPDASGYRHNYARYAIWCQKYPEFLQQVSLFPSTNFAFFGGEEQFRALVDYAKSKVGHP
jgi:hypothetical protein